MRKKYLLSLFSILFVACILRMYKLGINNLWYDEGATFFITNYYDSLTDLLRYPFFGYYLFMKIWLTFFEPSVFMLRLPSVIFNIITIIIFYHFLLVEFKLPFKTIFLATIYFSTSSFNIWYAQEATAYSMIILFSFVVFILGYRILNKKTITIREFFLLIFFMLLAISIDYFLVFYSIIFLATGSIIAYIYKNFRFLKQTMILLLLCILSAFLIKNIFYNSRSSYIWVQPVSMQYFFLPFYHFILGYIFDLKFFRFFYPWVSILFFLLLVACYKKNKQLVLFLIIPVASVFGLQYLQYNAFLTRKLIIIYPLLYIIFAVVLQNVKRFIKIFMIVIFSILHFLGTDFYYSDTYNYDEVDNPQLYSLINQGVHYKFRNDNLVKYLQLNSRKDDVVFYASLDLDFVFYYWSHYYFNEELRGYFVFRDIIDSQAYDLFAVYDFLKKTARSIINGKAKNLNSFSNLDFHLLNLTLQKLVDNFKFNQEQKQKLISLLNYYSIQNKNNKRQFKKPLFPIFLSKETLNLISAHRIWFLFSNWERKENFYSYESYQVLQWLKDNLKEKDFQFIDGVYVFLFEIT